MLFPIGNTADGRTRTNTLVCEIFLSIGKIIVCVRTAIGSVFNGKKDLPNTPSLCIRMCVHLRVYIHAYVDIYLYV